MENISIKQKVIKLFSDILEIEESDISLDSSFFEMGGHSLKVVRLMTELKSKFDVKFELKFLLSNTTVNEISCAINEKRGNSYERNLD